MEFKIWFWCLAWLEWLRLQSLFISKKIKVHLSIMIWKENSNNLRSIMFHDSSLFNLSVICSFSQPKWTHDMYYILNSFRKTNHSKYLTLSLVLLNNNIQLMGRMHSVIGKYQIFPSPTGQLPFTVNQAKEDKNHLAANFSMHLLSSYICYLIWLFLC